MSMYALRTSDIPVTFITPFVKVHVTLVGTSIDQAGASLSLLELDDELKALLDAPADTPAMTVV